MKDAPAPARLLDRIGGPGDLKALSHDELIRLAAEVRALIIETVSRTGGHLAANLGVVELTLALLRTFDLPADRIVWDTGHQTYAYKILTGRKDRIETLRQLGGLSGFPVRRESPYDAFGVGHAGTALSAALGMAAARDLRGGSENVVAVVGDASLGCGISFEALNNISAAGRLIVILNDNEMSISANVGSISRYLGRLLASPRYNRVKSSIERRATRYLKRALFRRIYYRVEEAIKGFFLRSVLFEELGLRYVGPIDGHDLRELLDAMHIARASRKPILLHVSTQKGRGYPFAERNPEGWHGTGCFDIGSGERPAAGRPTYSEVFGTVLAELAARDERIVAITAAMPAGTGLTGFAKRFAGRFYDVGISEEHAVVFAAGLAASEQRPFVAIYSTFMQRAVDCVIHDVCLQQLPVVMCLDRGGIVGDDGPTHHGIFDIALLAPVPGLVIMQPKDEAELAAMMVTAAGWSRPVVIRYPRGCGPGAPFSADVPLLELGRAEVLEPGRAVQIWALGDMIPVAAQAAAALRKDGIEAGVVNARFVKPLDEALLARQAGEARLFVTLENGVRTGGFGSLVEDALGRLAFRGGVLRFGWPDEFVPHGAGAALMDRYGLTAGAVARAVTARLAGPV